MKEKMTIHIRAARRPSLAGLVGMTVSSLAALLLSVSAAALLLRRLSRA